MAEKKDKKNPFGGIVSYFKDVRGELKKVVWPTFKQIRNNTIIVIVCIVIVGAFISVLDLGFSSTLGKAVSKFNTTSQSSTPEGQGTSLPIDGLQQQGQQADQAGGVENQPTTGSQENGQ